MSSLGDDNAIVRKMLSEDTFSQWMGIEVIEASPGSCTVAMQIRPDMVNGLGIAHGGIAYSCADSAMAFASNAHGIVAVALNNTMSYPAKLVIGDRIVAKATEISITRRTAIYDVFIAKEDGETVAIFRGTVYRTNKTHDQLSG